jgi:hypothetical protein
MVHDHGALDEELEALDTREFLSRLFHHLVKDASDTLVRVERNGRQPDERQQHDPDAEQKTRPQGGRSAAPQPHDASSPFGEHTHAHMEALA